MRIYKRESFIDGDLIGVAVTSGETKPTDGIVCGSEALECDTGDYYLFDGTDWNKMLTLKEE